VVLVVLVVVVMDNLVLGLVRHRDNREMQTPVVVLEEEMLLADLVLLSLDIQQVPKYSKSCR